MNLLGVIIGLATLTIGMFIGPPSLKPGMNIHYKEWENRQKSANILTYGGILILFVSCIF